MGKDKMITALAFDKQVRVIAAVTTETVNKAITLHGLLPVPAAALGRALTGTVFMSSMMKNDTDKLTLQIHGKGPLGGIVVTGDRLGHVRGYVGNPTCDLPVRADGKLDVSGAVGKGYLQVLKDIGMKEPYVGLVPLISGEIAEDLTYYFASSEQINSAIGLGVLIAPSGEALVAGGYMLQLLPGATEECISFLEKRLAELPSVTGMMATDQARGGREADVPAVACDAGARDGADTDERDAGERDADEVATRDAADVARNMVRQIFGEHSVEFLTESECGYVCDCSRERMERNLISLGKKELYELAEEEPETELVCHFCNSKYRFTSEELKALVE